MEWSLIGAHENITTSHTASGMALVEACDTIRAGRSKCILVVGCDALSLPRLQAEDSDLPQGEAAAALVVELSGENALAEIAGCGIAPDSERAISAALKSAGLNAAELTTLYTSGDSVSLALPRPSLRLEALCGELAGASTVACVAAALIKGLNGATLILTAEKKAAVAVIIKPC